MLNRIRRFLPEELMVKLPVDSHGETLQVPLLIMEREAIMLKKLKEIRCKFFLLQFLPFVLDLFIVDSF